MVAPGADVKEGQPVMELETDKAVIEVPSSVSGVVKEIRVKEGDKLKVGQVIFTVENGAGGAKSAALSSEAPTPPVPGKPSAPEKEFASGEAGVPARPDAPSAAAESALFVERRATPSPPRPAGPSEFKL